MELVVYVEKFSQVQWALAQELAIHTFAQLTHR